MPIRNDPLPERRERPGAIIHPPDFTAKLKAKEYPMDTSPEIMTAIRALPPEGQQEVMAQTTAKYPDEIAALPPEPEPTEEDKLAAKAAEVAAAEEAKKEEAAAKDAEAAAKAQLDAEVAAIMDAIAKLEPTGSLPGLLEAMRNEFEKDTAAAPKAAKATAAKKTNGEPEHEKNKKH